MGAAYLVLDLSHIVINNTVLSTPRGDDSLSDEFDDSVHMVEQEVKDSGMVIAQPIPEGLVAPTVSLAINLSSEGGPNIVNPTISMFLCLSFLCKTFYLLWVSIYCFFLFFSYPLLAFGFIC